MSLLNPKGGAISPLLVLSIFLLEDVVAVRALERYELNFALENPFPFGLISLLLNACNNEFGIGWIVHLKCLCEELLEAGISPRITPRVPATITSNIGLVWICLGMKYSNAGILEPSFESLHWIRDAPPLALNPIGDVLQSGSKVSYTVLERPILDSTTFPCFSSTIEKCTNGSESPFLSIATKFRPRTTVTRSRAFTSFSPILDFCNKLAAKAPNVRSACRFAMYIRAQRGTNTRI
mmetsp:Transcript_1748/g.2823  ORF Transcript_1748/g.2823 Transcript_1748/m.2823 type:complete len:237 (-) Transcript_1748:4255-4965(-)